MQTLNMEQPVSYVPAYSAQLPQHVTAVMEIRLDCVRHNYRFIQGMLAQGSRAAAVLKADAYGLGAARIAHAVSEAGCKHFYAATLDEAIQLRRILKDPQAFVFMLNGLLPGMEEHCVQYQIAPVLNAVEQIFLWSRVARNKNLRLPAAIHFDTGISRAGISYDKAQEIANLPELKDLNIQFILSHLACSDQPAHEKNLQQLERFEKIKSYFPHVPGSFSNSHGILLGERYHFQQVRPGRGLYGVASKSLTTHGLRQAVRVYTKVLQIRDIAVGETVGYNATFKAERPLRLALLSMGYADGLLRTRTHNGVIHIQGYPAYIVGRISMDLLTVDVTDIPEALVYPGTWAEYVGDHRSFDEAAESAGTISHEILVNCGSRYYKNYLDIGA